LPTWPEMYAPAPISSGDKAAKIVDTLRCWL
jgi:hypothetical protein